MCWRWGGWRSGVIGSSIDGRGSWPAALGVAALEVAAARADNDSPVFTGWQTAADVAVGLAFVVAGGLAAGALRLPHVVRAGRGDVVDRFADDRRRAFPSSGAARSRSSRSRAGDHEVGSAGPALRLRSRSPSTWGRGSGCRRCSSRLPRWCRCCRGAGERWRPSTPPGPRLAIAVALECSWLSDQGVIDVDRSTITSAYELAMASVAIGYVVTARVLAARRAHVHDWVLGDDRLAGLDGLAVVLRELFRDPDLTILRSPGPGTGDANDAGARRRISTAPSEARYPITDDEGGAGSHRLPGECAGGRTTASAVAKAVQLAARHQRLQEQLAVQLDELQAARTRLVEAADRDRALVAAPVTRCRRLSVARTADELRAIDADASHGEAAEAIGVVVQQLSRGGRRDRPRSWVERLRYRSARAVFIERSKPSPRAAPFRSPWPSPGRGRRSGGRDGAVLCLSARRWPTRSSTPRRPGVIAWSGDDGVVLTVADDGCGGAEPSVGAVGLADRLARAVAGSGWTAHRSRHDGDRASWFPT